VRSDVVEFIGIYDADSTLWGEVSYWIGARLGRTHCSLCDITHGMFTEKSQWKTCRAELPVQFRTFHRNDAPNDALLVAEQHFPIVLVRTKAGIEIVMNREELERFHGSPEQFAEALNRFIAER
jgi:hypothetical protein